VIGNQDSVLFKSSLKLGVLRLLDRVGGQSPLDAGQQEDLRQHVRETAQNVFKRISTFKFSRVIGTSGTIRSLGEACLIANDKTIVNSVNAEVVKVGDLEKIVKKLLQMEPEKRSDIPGISPNRVDAVHLGGLLLLELLELAGADKITLCDASLREGLIIDYIEKNGQKLEEIGDGKNLRERSSLLMASRYGTDIEAKKHVSRLAMKLFDQLKDLTGLNDQSRELLFHACLIYDVGLYVNFQDYQKHSSYLILHGRLRGFNNEELMLLSHLARYHRKSDPKKRHKKFRRLDKNQRSLLRGLAGILRIAVGLDKTKNQWVENIDCQIDHKKITIKIFGEENLDMEIWEAQRHSDTLSGFLKRKIDVVKG
jgi:exopolyphosphatase/guanosine-5'-triphosphate,3'-diphosphate pyrophosphatase